MQTEVYVDMNWDTEIWGSQQNTQPMPQEYKWGSSSWPNVWYLKLMATISIMAKTSYSQQLIPTWFAQINIKPTIQIIFIFLLIVSWLEFFFFFWPRKLSPNALMLQLKSQSLFIIKRKRYHIQWSYGGKDGRNGKYGKDFPLLLELPTAQFILKTSQQLKYLLSIAHLLY